MKNSLFFGSNNDKWATPQKFYDIVDEKYKFCFDLACDESNCKAFDGFTESENSLDQDWFVISNDQKKAGESPWLWLNPPYSECYDWVDKAYSEHVYGAKIVMLLPARTDTRYFHDFIYKKEDMGIIVEFIKGRLVFGSDSYWENLWKTEYIGDKKNPLFGKFGRKDPAPFPSMLVIFG